MAGPTSPSEEYALLGHNQISIEEGTSAEVELYERIKFHFSTAKDNRFHLYVLAASIRNRYRDKKNDKYPNAFYEWFRRRKLKDIFKSTENFVYYAGAGDVVNSVATNHETDLAQLPSSVSALYRIWDEVGRFKDVKSFLTLRECIRFP